jgi:hypothetical protein
LTEYTTFANQTKDTSNQPVNIGLHYVAATNNLSLITHNSPLDSDSDGVPDYVEAEHGTDIHNPLTDGVTNDTYNVAYDDVDLSGNGLVGRIKKALGLNPLERNNPLTLKQIAHDETNGIVTFEVPVSYDLLTNIGSLYLLADGGKAASFQEFDRNTNGNSLLRWNTTFDPPGQHYVQTKLTILGNRGGRGQFPDSRVFEAAGKLSPYYSSNICQFDPFYSEFDGNGVTLYAKTPQHPATDYLIELLTQTGTHVKTISGSSSTGKVSEHWDLTDDNGNAVAANDMKAIFTITPPNGDPTPLSFYIYRLPEPITLEENFTIAYAWDNTAQAQHSMRDAILHGVVNPLLSPLQSGGSGSLNPYTSTFNEYSWSGNLRGNPGWISSPAAVPPLTNNLAYLGTKNFYFDGHGSRQTIGNSESPTNPGSINIIASDMSQLLFNKQKTRPEFLHPYRFVFLNACGTADDATWAHTFGIYETITYDQASQRRPQAFVGWHGEARAPETSDEWYEEQKTLSVFFNAWMMGWPLENCIDAASQTRPPAPFNSYLLGFPLGIKFSWWDANKPINYSDNSFHIRVFGYAGITRSGFETGYDHSKYQEKD